MLSWPLRSSPLMALKAVFPHEKRNKCEPHDWGSKGCQIGKQSCLLKQSAGLRFSAVLPLPQTHCGRGPDVAGVQMWPGSGCRLPHSLNPHVCRGHFLQLSPHPHQRLFPAGRGNVKGFSGSEHMLQQGGFLRLL